jgi:hypothetical protein
MDKRLVELRKKVTPILKPYAKRISVFGSYARGEETPQSDIDILVELKPAKRRPTLGFKWFGLEQELSKALGREVDLVSQKALSRHLQTDVKKESITLYEER